MRTSGPTVSQPLLPLYPPTPLDLFHPGECLPCSFSSLPHISAPLSTFRLLWVFSIHYSSEVTSYHRMTIIFLFTWSFSLLETCSGVSIIKYFLLPDNLPTSLWSWNLGVQKDHLQTCLECRFQSYYPIMSDSNIWGEPKNLLTNIHDDSDVVDSRSTLWEIIF